VIEAESAIVPDLAIMAPEGVERSIPRESNSSRESVVGGVILTPGKSLARETLRSVVGVVPCWTSSYDVGLLKRSTTRDPLRTARMRAYEMSFAMRSRARRTRLRSMYPLIDGAAALTSSAMTARTVSSSMSV
jgi:hypothetical protein